MKTARIVFCLLISGLGACAQILPSAPKPAAPASNTDPLNRDSPQSSVVAFLEAAHAKNYNKAWRYMDLRSMPQEQAAPEERELARELAAILDRDTQFDVGNLSRRSAGGRRGQSSAESRSDGHISCERPDTGTGSGDESPCIPGFPSGWFRPTASQRIPLSRRSPTTRSLNGTCRSRWSTRS